jgi:hypothetical protein
MDGNMKVKYVLVHTYKKSQLTVMQTCRIHYKSQTFQ